MEADQIQSVEITAPGGTEEEKQKWIEEHACSMQHLFDQWQKPLGIDSEKFRKHLTEELVSYYDEPLLKSLIESIT